VKVILAENRKRECFVIGQLLSFLNDISILKIFVNVVFKENFPEPLRRTEQLHPGREQCSCALLTLL